MGEQQIGNPEGAFQPLIEQSIPPGTPEQTIKSMYNSGSTAILAGGWVALDDTGTSGHVNGCTAGLHGGDLKDAIGIAIDAIAVGGYGRVCVGGPAHALGSTAGISAGDQITGATASTDDQCVQTASSPTVGQVIGTALEASAAVVKTPLRVWVRSA